MVGYAMVDAGARNGKGWLFWLKQSSMLPTASSIWLQIKTKNSTNIA